jgi:predicted nicotinamide N-methyase
LTQWWGIQLLEAFSKLLKIKSPIHVSEIKLYSVVPQEQIYPYEINEFNTMYGYPTWSGIALARFILDNPEKFNGLEITDLGSGSGIATIAAAMVGAKVTAIDQDVASLYFTQENCKLNNVSANFVWGSFRDIQTDCVMMSSLFYNTKNHKPIKDLLSKNKVLIGGNLHDNFDELPKIKVNAPREMYVCSNFISS